MYDAWASIDHYIVNGCLEWKLGPFMTILPNTLFDVHRIYFVYIIYWFKCVNIVCEFKWVIENLLLIIKLSRKYANLLKTT